MYDRPKLGVAHLRGGSRRTARSRRRREPKMAHLASEIEVDCPCCGSTLVVDVSLRRVLSHHGPVRDDVPELSDAQRLLVEAAARREAVLRQSVADEKGGGAPSPRASRRRSGRPGTSRWTRLRDQRRLRRGPGAAVKSDGPPASAPRFASAPRGKLSGRRRASVPRSWRPARCGRSTRTLETVEINYVLPTADRAPARGLVRVTPPGFASP